MALTPRNRPSHKPPNHHTTITVHCPMCAATDSLKGHQVGITLYRGSYTVAWTCTHCTQPVNRAYFTEEASALESLGKMSDAFIPTHLVDAEMDDPVRTGATTIDLKTNTALSLSAVEQAWKDFIGKYKSDNPDM